MRKYFVVTLVTLLVIGLAVPVCAVLDDNSTSYDQSQGQIATGGKGGNADADAVAASASKSKASAIQGQKQGQAQGQGQIAAQGQGQLGVVSPSQDVSVGGDTNKYQTYVMTAPNTVAGQGQQASSIYSIFGGINMAGTAEYQICKEKIDVATLMVKNGYLTEAEGKAEALEAYAQLKKSTQRKRVLGILNETDGLSLWNGFGAFAFDSCPLNVDNWFGSKNLLTKPLKK